jgi:hypothetical protein
MKMLDFFYDLLPKTIYAKFGMAPNELSGIPWDNLLDPMINRDTKARAGWHSTIGESEWDTSFHFASF